MSKQSDKYKLGMSGEFYVAAQLHRMGFNASVTYGNSKKADITVFQPQSEKYAQIEVKTTSNSKWVVGSRVPEKSKQLWIFVYLPYDINEAPKFYILFQHEIHAILKPIETDYFQRYKKKHGVEYGNKSGVASLKRSLVDKYQNNWSKITERLDS